MSRSCHTLVRGQGDELVRIGPLGTREVVALGLLIIAVIAGVSVTLLRPDDQAETQAAEDRIAERTAAANPDRNKTPTRTPTPRPTALPAIGIDAPEGWQIRYESVSSSGAAVPEGQFAIESLNLSFPAAPFLDMRDNQWRVIVAADLNAERPGPWEFTIDYQGSVKVFVGEQLVGEGSSDKPAKLEIEAPSQYANSSIRIEAADTGGAFLLRWE